MADFRAAYANTLAGLDFDEQRLRRVLARKLEESKAQAAISITGNQEEASSRGMLHGGEALKSNVDTNTLFAKQDASSQEDFNYDLGSIGRQRAAAESDLQWNTAEEQRLAALEAPLVTAPPNYQMANEADPLNWRGIAAEQKALGNPAYADWTDPQAAAPAGPPNDPLNWAAIARQLGNQGDPNFAQYKDKVQPITPPRSARTV